MIADLTFDYRKNNTMKRAQGWTKEITLHNIWLKKGYDLIYGLCDCPCGHGHLRKDEEYFEKLKQKKAEAVMAAEAEKCAAKDAAKKRQDSIEENEEKAAAPAPGTKATAKVQIPMTMMKSKKAAIPYVASHKNMLVNQIAMARNKKAAEPKVCIGYVL